METSPKQRVYNLIILDESGSMATIMQPTIQGFNEVVQTIRGVQKQFPDQQHFISLVTFNGLGVKTKLFNEPAEILHELDARMYQPDASTPLYDAIGFSINKLKSTLYGVENHHVLVTILTDGEENASKEFSGQQVRQLIDDLKQQAWTFTYIGANHNVQKAAFSLSITNTLQFKADAAGTDEMFARDRRSRVAYSQKLSRGEDVKGSYFVGGEGKKGES
ncbi:MAG: VWA domain-containing protein [Sphingobacteriaceae bacterium]|nr:VWA domain-containing protein [Cytophagaceae bacterium]